ncbi:DUF6744 family protein [Senegalia massiliensis]|uniref:Uncharacterized protein n=1 Tax=Senegalia massiliensis TaxID=1720316 RepID=A0A845R263_9CLOT|nr:DUF6744 family protein [Senegalia massiliensis]NBI07638.1 hypothetical protein [Senegalia massiliensis]
MNSNFVAINSNVEGNNIIGKLVYYTIGETMLNEKEVFNILDDCGISKDIVAKKHTSTQAFKTATKKIQKRGILLSDPMTGDINKYHLIVEDNKTEDNGNLWVREIKLEKVKERNNNYTYMGNFIYDKVTDKASYSLNSATMKSVGYDITKLCDYAMEEFEREAHGFNKNRLNNFMTKYMKEILDGSSVKIRAKVWFVPIYKANELLKLENFIEILSKKNTEDGTVEIMSIPLMHEEKYVERYTREFHNTVNFELNEIYKHINRIMKQENSRPETMDTWIQKGKSVLEKKQKYEKVFKRNFEVMEEDMEILNRQLQELEIRKEKRTKEIEKNK